MTDLEQLVAQAPQEELPRLIGQLAQARAVAATGAHSRALTGAVRPLGVEPATYRFVDHEPTPDHQLDPADSHDLPKKESR